MNNLIKQLFILLTLIVGLAITFIAIMLVWTIVIIYSAINWVLDLDGFSHSTNKKPTVKFDRQAIFDEVDKSSIRMSTMTKAERDNLRLPVTRYGVPTNERFGNQ